MISSSSQNINMTTTRNTVVKDDDNDVEDQELDHKLPGFRFHPTDEELVGFYLRRKVDKKPLSIELIRQIDIYKFDPWDLPKTSTTPDKEGYFFCKRGRKYRNSIRPNRVTGSGFWKATGIDKQVYSLGGEGEDCIGLKKTLVYYRGSAGKGTKTDWMMHEFRLPISNDNGNSNNVEISLQEAEVWTICRIFKRNVSQRKLYTPADHWRSSSDHQSKRNSTVVLQPSSNGTIITCSAADTSNIVHQHEGYNISFEAPVLHHQNNKKHLVNHHHHRGRRHHHDNRQINQTIRNIPNPLSTVDHQMMMITSSSIAHNPPPLPPSPALPQQLLMAPSSSNFQTSNLYGNDHQLFTHDQNWADELRSAVGFGFDPALLLDR
ncbi:hypothetical protein ACOSQ2_027932 [Xanthoceras sorbifolium]